MTTSAIFFDEENLTLVLPLAFELPRTLEIETSKNEIASLSLICILCLDRVVAMCHLLLLDANGRDMR
jgi:hypothetical protein